MDARARGQFAEAEVVNLTMAVVASDGWNMVAVGFRSVPGTYRAGAGT